MSRSNLLQRREVMAGLAGLGAALANAPLAAAQDASAHTGHATHDALAPAPRSPQSTAVVLSTADCQRAGRVCLARCTDHLASGMEDMADCQRAVMNMLAVTSAMADVAGFANASADDMQSLAATCARFCDACAKACEPHASRYEECRACREACLVCAKACRALAA